MGASKPPHYVTVMPATHRDTIVRLGVDSRDDEWFVWRDDVIGWGLYMDEDGDATLQPFVWGDYGCAVEYRHDTAENVATVGRYARDEMPSAADLIRAAEEVREQLALNAATVRKS